VKDVWSEIVPKGEIIEQNEERRKGYTKFYQSPDSSPPAFRCTLFAFVGEGSTPYFVRNNEGRLDRRFSKVCTIQADLSEMRGSLRRVRRSSYDDDRPVCWTLDFDIVIFFGGTELKAAIAWTDKQGVEHRGDATVIPPEFT
jgi:hypothetical protein